MSANDFQQIMDAYFGLYKDKQSPFIFFDEIQNISGWEKFARRINDQGYRVFLTGSNSRLLSREIATELRGRTLVYEIFPFSFIEFLAAKRVTLNNNILYGSERHQIRQLFEEYLFTGGYPEIVFIKDKITKSRILQDYFNTVFYKDLVERYKIKNRELLRHWLNALIMNISSLVSFSKIENDFKSRGMKLSRATLSTFARYIEDTFFGFFVEIHSESIRKRQVNPKKFYLVDQGLHNFLTLSFAENKGRILENMVFLELKRRGFPVYYYKTKGGLEVDFLLMENGNNKLVQVCYDMAHINTYNREKKALLAGISELGLSTGLILTKDEKRLEKHGNYSLKIVPVWEWLLNLK